MAPLLRVAACLGALASAVAATGIGQSQARSSAMVIEDIGASAFPLKLDDTDNFMIPETNGTRFFERDADEQTFHRAPRGGNLPRKVYDSPSSLLFVPKGFRPDAPAAVILFLHGNLARLDRDVVRRQRVPAQVEASHANVLLVAPQLALDALDSSAGNFWTPGFFDRYLDKAAERLAGMPGVELPAERIAALPVVIVAYSGGYLPTAFSLMYARDPGRRPIAGVILLDALFGEEAKFADWIKATSGRGFFVSLYSKASADLNARLERDIADVPFARALPAHLGPGDVVFQSVPNAVHNDFVTRAGTADPLAAVLARLDLSRLAGGVPRE